MFIFCCLTEQQNFITHETFANYGIILYVLCVLGNKRVLTASFLNTFMYIERLIRMHSYLVYVMHMQEESKIMNWIITGEGIDFCRS